MINSTVRIIFPREFIRVKIETRFMTPHKRNIIPESRNKKSLCILTTKMKLNVTSLKLLYFTVILSVFA